MDQQAQLDEIAADIIDSNTCGDLAAQATQLVFGEGNPDASIVLIGEAPGKQEDLQGRPFVGASGRFLDEMLQAAGLSRSDVYITNIVKYRPPGNRDPRPEEKQAFWPYLARQLEVIEPKIVATLGRHSLEFFIPNAKISQVHGRVVATNSWLVVPLYHPAAALYNGSMRQTLINDFMAAFKIATSQNREAEGVL